MMRTQRDTLLLVGFLVATTGGRAAGQSSPCLSNPDTGASHAWYVKRTVTYTDSAVLARQGLPYRPAQGVALVTDSVVCRRAINAYNARIPAGDRAAVPISRAYVLRVGTTAYALVPENNTDLYIYFDSTNYNWLAGMMASR